MIPAFCRIKHDPENGKYGDCVRACIASILEVDTRFVPHFSEHGENAAVSFTAARAWLKQTHGLSLWLSALPVENFGNDRDTILDAIAQINPDQHYILFGFTDHDTGHAVVCLNGTIVHNPSWGGDRVIKPISNSVWLIGVVTKA